MDAALRSGASVAVIAEIKRRSPSRGWINQDVDVAAQAHAYDDGGAAAISVLTDAEFFSGGASDLAEARRTVELPILRKDFTVSANDVLDAAEMGASAVLLIAAVLDDDELALFIDVAARAGLDALVEVHDQTDARRAVDVGATIVGVNQRDLTTFEVVAGRATEVTASLPANVVVVAESGLSTRGDVEAAAAAGVDAVLIGEALMRAKDPAAALAALAGVERVARA